MEEEKGKYLGERFPDMGAVGGNIFMHYAAGGLRQAAGDGAGQGGISERPYFHGNPVPDGEGPAGADESCL